jgi:hypothetical protein
MFCDDGLMLSQKPSQHVDMLYAIVIAAVIIPT